VRRNTTTTTRARVQNLRNRANYFILGDPMTTLLMKKLVAKYLVAAMISWVPFSNQIQRADDGTWLHEKNGMYLKEDEADARARYESIADDIVEIAFDDTLKPLFTGDDGRLKTALALTAVPSLEGGFHKWVDDGTCNTAKFQLHLGHVECDGGHAWSIWQLHMYNYVIKDGELTQAQYLQNSLKPEDRDWMRAHQGEIITPQQIVADRKLAVKIAYYLMYYSLHNFHSLCAYSGERCDGSHPLADHRLSRGIDYLRAHPFVVPPPEQLAQRDLADRSYAE